jgi:hypothetical protein
MSKLPDCIRGNDLLFLAEEFKKDHPDGSVHGFCRYLMDNDMEIRSFLTEEIDRSNWPEDITDFVMDNWTGKLR